MLLCPLVVKIFKVLGAYLELLKIFWRPIVDLFSMLKDASECWKHVYALLLAYIMGIWFNRHLRRDLKFYEKHVPCKVALIQDSLSVELLKPFHTNASRKVVSEHMAFCSKDRFVQTNSDEVENANCKRSIISSVSYFASLSSQDSSDILGGSMTSSSSLRSQNQSVISYEESQSSKQLGMLCMLI